MKKIILFSLIILFLTKTQNVFAKTDTFIVDNIIVTGKITNNNYRAKYFAIAFKTGFENLIQNILKSEDRKKLSNTDLKTIKSLIENYRITKEEVQDNNYKLQMELKFSRKLINDFFYKKNISYSETTKLNIIVYPILILDSELQLFSNNKFLKEWNDNEDLKNIDFILPIENVDDINFIKDNLPILEEINLKKLVDNYEMDNSSILIFRSNNKKLNVFLKTNFKGSKRVKKFEFGIENLENKEARLKVIRSLKFYINDFWKEQNLIDISIPSYLTVRAKIKNLNTLPNIIKKLEKISLISNYNVEVLDKNSVRIKIKYFGKIKNLQDSFISNGFNFKVSHNEWSLVLKS